MTLLTLSDTQMFWIAWFVPVAVMALGCFALDWLERRRR